MAILLLPLSLLMASRWARRLAKSQRC